MRPTSTTADWLARARLGIAALVVLASLLAISSWWKSATCGCGSRGLPWETIAVAATVGAGVAMSVYVAVSVAARNRCPRA